MVVKRREMKGHSLEGRTEAKSQADESLGVREHYILLRVGKSNNKTQFCRAVGAASAVGDR
jgi:hypothetical protein